jgi:MFS transporter, DHA2 family, multidrug resistance protein
MTHPATGEPLDELVLARRGRRQAIIALMVATAMQAFDATIVNVALPRLEASFGGNIALGTWVMTSYLCAAAVTAPLTGWLRRRYGARQLIIGAVSFFVLASLVCSLAPSRAFIILFRILQGAAAGVIQPLAQATLLDISPKREHGRMLALWGATIMIGPVIGPALGGALTDLASWRLIFAINLPIGMIAAIGLRRLPASVEGRREADFDLRGIVLLGIGVGALQLALERGIGRNPLTSPEIVVEAAVALFSLSAVGFQSLRARFSLFNFQVFKDVNFSAAVFYTFMIGGLLFSTIVLVPALSEGPLGYSAMMAGLILFPARSTTASFYSSDS